MGTPVFSVTVLDALAAAGHQIACVYTQPPRPAGRGKTDRPSPVHSRAQELGLPVRHPTSLKDPDDQAAFAALKADVAVVVAYGLILPQSILEAPALGCLNIHASLLPRWRGAAPIQRAIMAGDATTGISIMAMEAGLDTGPVLLTRSVTIGEGETAGALHDRLADAGAGLIVEALDAFADLTPQPQSDDGVTYAAKIDKTDAKVDWSRPARDVANHIRGLSPNPGAYVVAGDERIKLLAARAIDGNGTPGTVLSGFTVACGVGAVEITRAQRPGKRAVDAKAFLRGFALPDRLD